jgi:hypothetical protein
VFVAKMVFFSACGVKPTVAPKFNSRIGTQLSEADKTIASELFSANTPLLLLPDIVTSRVSSIVLPMFLAPDKDISAESSLNSIPSRISVAVNPKELSIPIDNRLLREAPIENNVTKSDVSFQEAPIVINPFFETVVDFAAEADKLVAADSVSEYSVLLVVDVVAEADKLIAADSVSEYSVLPAVDVVTEADKLVAADSVAKYSVLLVVDVVAEADKLVAADSVAKYSILLVVDVVAEADKLVAADSVAKYSILFIVRKFYN